MDVVQMTTRIAGSIVDVAFVDGVRVLDWAPACVDGFTAHIHGVAHTITAAPLRVRLGIADVTFARVPRPPRGLPHARADHSSALYLVVSLALHLALFGTAATQEDDAARPGGPLVMLRPVRVVGYAPQVIEHHDTSHVSMRLGEPAHGKRSPPASARGRATAADVAVTMDGVASDTLGGTDLAAAMDGVGIAAGDARGFGEARTFGGDGDGTITAGDVAIGAPLQRGGSGRGLARTHEAGVPTITMCGRPGVRRPSPCIRITGELDKALIRRYVRRQRPKIQHCYERALLTDPTLEGTVDTEFEILADGSVADPRAAGVSTAITSCVVDVLSAIEFPRSVGGGTTEVHYPFTFRVAG
jgi:hypothetical protein